ncbi:MAG: hypothetical protein KDA76_01315 [Planctomycetaceae bacterium]|nr:hypothetical protein [Planctomycetaceae bacterium]
MERAEELLNRIGQIHDQSTHRDKRLPQRLTDTMLALVAFQSQIDDPVLEDELNSLVVCAIQVGMSAAITLHSKEINAQFLSKKNLEKGRLRNRSKDQVKETHASWQRIADDYLSRQETVSKSEIARRIKEKTGCEQTVKTICSRITIARPRPDGQLKKK